jgi:rhamnulokinase
MDKKRYLALDLGAESGRVILGSLENNKLHLSEERRFTTGPIGLPTKYPSQSVSSTQSDISLVWDFPCFWQEIKEGIKSAQKKGPINSIGVDAWGVDFGLLDRNGLLLSLPFHYRDQRTNGMMEEVFTKIPKERIFEITGIQFMPINTIYQLFSLSSSHAPILEIANKLLMVPDLINYWLTGKAVGEFTNNTTTQLFDSRKRTWSEEIISALGLPVTIFPEIVPPGTILGPMRQSLTDELNCNTKVIVPVTHDTGSAVAAIPDKAEDFIWISSGTWSIVGMNTDQPIINDESYQSNFTNEGGVEGTFRFSKNVMGLWILQQCKAQWKQMGRDYSYDDLTRMANEAPHLKSFIDPDFNEFISPGEMIDKVKLYCQNTQQPVPETDGEVVRAVLQGLALRYRYVIESLERISGQKTSTIHIVGGGSKNRILNQFTADVTGRHVYSGPVEATAIGNIIVQAIANGDIRSWQEGVEVINNSFDIEVLVPSEKNTWNAAYSRFVEYQKKAKLAF